MFFTNLDVDDILSKLKLKTNAFYSSAAANRLKIAAEPEVNNCIFSPTTSILKPKNIFNSNKTNNNNNNHINANKVIKFFDNTTNNNKFSFDFLNRSLG
jgi:hypothetical protein